MSKTAALLWKDLFLSDTEFSDALAFAMQQSPSAIENLFSSVGLLPAETNDTFLNMAAAFIVKLIQPYITEFIFTQYYNSMQNGQLMRIEYFTVNDPELGYFDTHSFSIQNNNNIVYGKEYFRGTWVYMIIID